MSDKHRYEIFLVALPGLEKVLAQEARAKGWGRATDVPGGVVIEGTWTDVWKANLVLRGATRVLVRVAEFKAPHLATLDKKCRAMAWDEFIPEGASVTIDAAAKTSQVYHTGAIVERVTNALHDKIGAKVEDDAPIQIKVRFVRDMCTISLDTTGAPLHKRGHKQSVNKAPLRETLASLLLSSAKFMGTETVYDPMCGSGTFPIEAAEMALGLAAGRSRSFGFQHLKSFDQSAWEELKAKQPEPKKIDLKFFGSDRDDGAVAMSKENAERAGLSDYTSFRKLTISDVRPPVEEPGLVIINPPYGERIGDKKKLFGLYKAFGSTMKTHFKGWRIAFVASDQALAESTELPLTRPGPIIPHGGIKIRLYQTRVLKG